MNEKEKRTLLKRFANWLGITQRNIKDVDEWDGAASNYSSTEAYCNACLINVNTGDPEDWTQTNCKLPIREEGDSEDTFVRQAVYAAAGGRGITQVEKPADASAEDWENAVRDAANQLVRAYNEMEEDVPDSIVELAERQKRALSNSQLWGMVYEQLEAMYNSEFWIMDIFYGADDMPFVIVAVDGKLYRHSIMLDEDMTTISEAIPVMQEFVPTARTTTTIKRTVDNRWRWFSISASSVLNRSGEIDSRDLFDSFVAHAEETGEYPVRMFYHSGLEFRTGQADFLARDDNLYITSGLYDETEIAEMEVKARQKEPDYWGDSIGYLPTSQPEPYEATEGVTIPVYKRGINKEISTLPEKEAANLFTANTEMLEVRRTMALKGKQKEAFIKIFDGDEEAANTWLDEHAEARNRSIEEDGLITRSEETSETEVTQVETEEQAEPQEVVNELSDEDVARALDKSNLVNHLVSAIEALSEQVEIIEQASNQRQKQLTDRLQEMAQRIETLEADDETKQREWLQNQPRRFNGKVKHIIRPRVERSEDEDENKTSAEIAAETIASKSIPVY